MIRARKDGNLMLSLLPAESASVFARELGRSFPRDEKKLDAYFVATLRRIGSSSLPTDELYSVPKDLAKKILQAAIKHSETEKIISSVADKCYTHARVRRAINALVFGITAKRVSEKPPYTTVLAANEKGREVLRKAKSLKRIDIVNKPVRALELGEETKNAFLFAKGIEDVISLSDPIPSPADAGRNPFIGEQL
jgi:predicted nucleotidyltransferase